ncbi:YceI family protein [Halodesulfovibrio spirochaetisodalis]|uniref:Rhodanese domain-containing protein n=1 Tax=Halodesulfovibrio spirochaetisodalis TaxID=1560234 RepID=A0A1B7XBY9_9BACT|nr:YceI family protein [Halodesulfovibrio spirochaetisodalis]OBQ50268.1 hypothetical protein SP90_10155 [Halodesulfovibrio spirochaetisodalis]
MLVGQARELSCNEVKTLSQQDQPPVIIDLLPPEHFDKIRIPSAVNFCVFNANFIASVNDYLTTLDVPIVVYGSGIGSYDCLTAIEKLHHAGYTNLSAMKEGIEGWVAAGYPVEGSEQQLQKDEPVYIAKENRRWELDTSKSTVEWRGRKNTGFHVGTVNISGTLREEDGELRGKIVAAMHTINDLDLENDPMKQVLESHLNSEDFFYTQQFPTAEFEILHTNPTHIQSLTYPQVTATGALSIRGMRHVIEVPLLINELDATTISVETHFEIDRTKWGIIYGSSRFFKHLMYHKVFDLISFECVLFGNLRT